MRIKRSPLANECACVFALGKGGMLYIVHIVERSNPILPEVTLSIKMVSTDCSPDAPRQNKACTFVTWAHEKRQASFSSLAEHLEQWMPASVMAPNKDKDSSGHPQGLSFISSIIQALQGFSDVRFNASTLGCASSVIRFDVKFTYSRLGRLNIWSSKWWIQLWSRCR